ncbi:MAG: DUF4282 domain-containing protein [Planctomycetota bacterium]
MPIVTSCACGFRFKAPDKLAGRKARCPKCSEIVQIPALEAEAASAPIEEAAPPAEATRTTSPETETHEGPAALPLKEPAGEDALAPASPGAPAASPDETKDAEEPKIEAPAPEAPPPAAASPTTRRTGRFKKVSGEKGTSRAEKPAAAKTEKPEPKPSKPAGPSQPGAIGEFLSFKRMITPSIVKLLFWLGEFLLVLSGLGSVVSAILMMTARHGDVAMGLVMLVAGPVGTVVGMLLWRVMCESALLYFQVFDRLGEIRDLLAKGKEGGTAVSSAPVPAGPGQVVVAASTPALDAATSAAVAAPPVEVPAAEKPPAEAGSDAAPPPQA